MAKDSICIRCGNFKRSSTVICEHCSFEPKEPIDCAKSIVLGPPWSFTVNNDGDVIDTGRSIKELEEISLQIRGGQPYSFEEAELRGVLDQYFQFQATTKWQLFVTVFKWLLPPLLLGSAFLLAVYLDQ